MATLLVGYDLNKPTKDYSTLIERLRKFGTWWHHLDSTWLVRTELTPVQVRDELRRLIDADDELLVIDVSGRASAWAGFNQKGSQWLRDYP